MPDSIPVEKHNLYTNLLFIACQQGKHLFVPEILAAYPSIPINQPLHNGKTPLIIACINNNCNVVMELLKHPNIDVNAVETQFGASPLAIACLSGCSNILSELLRHPKVNVNQTMHSGETPLAIACAKGYHKIVPLLLADPRTENKQANTNGATPL